METIKLGLIAPGGTNPRKHFDEGALVELAASISKHGVLQPIIVRPWPASRKPPKGAPEPPYELVVGERRWRAARVAGLEEIPAAVREMTDDQVTEVQVVENLQRSDLHPLEEAEGYRQLMAKRYDVARIAERTGHGVRYVYDRVKLLSLTKAAQKLFLEGRITIGHAIVLARLSPADQTRVIGEENDEGWPEQGGLWQDEKLLFSPDDDEGGKRSGGLKPVSVRELEAWVDKHVKLEAAQADPMLFPDLAATAKEAAETREKVVRITHESITPEDAKDGPRPILGRSWKRADGTRGSKECERSVIGSIVIGPGRGEVLRVCVDKKHCTVHWGDTIKAAKEREKEVTKGGATGEDREAIRRRKEAEDRARQKAEVERWDKARPAIVAALATAVKKAPAGAGGALGKSLLEAWADYCYGQAVPAAKLVPPGKTAEDLVRHMAFQLVLRDVEDNYFQKEFIAQAKALGVDVPKILAAAAPVEIPPKAKKAKRKA